MFLGGDDDVYTLKMDLRNAGGLRDGSPVVIGGVPVGDVTLDATFDRVRVTMRVDPQYAPFGKDATAAIIAQNLLGQKQVRLTVGDAAGAPAPDGYTLPAPHVGQATDLDQFLSTLDADTRTRLAILVNETGTAFAGRELDFKTFLEKFAPAFDVGDQLVRQLNADNAALGNLIDTSNSYIGQLRRNGHHLGRMVDLVGRTTQTLAERRDALQATLARAPGALSSARTFLAELERATGPLDSTATLLRRTSPSLSDTLGRIEPFRAAAAPTLRDLTAAAPSLERLAVHGTSGLRSTVRPVGTLRAIVRDSLPGTTNTLDKSTDNALGAVDNWSHAIQFSDGLGHVFRGEVGYSPETYDRYLQAQGIDLTPQNRRRKGKRRPRPASPAPAAPAPAAEPPTSLLDQVLPKTRDTLDELLRGIGGGRLPDTKAVNDLLGPVGEKLAPQASKPLLDYLLGK
jgi:virulence factor Mce-like protein